MHSAYIVFSPLLFIILVYLAVLWRQGTLAKRAAIAAREAYEAKKKEPFDPYARPRIFDSNLKTSRWKFMSVNTRITFRKSLNLNVLAMLEHERLKEYRYKAMRLDRAAGLGGPTWHNSSPYSSRQTPA